MNINYPLKSTQENQLSQVFETYINSYYGPQAWSPVKECFEKMGKLRSSFEFQKFNISLSTDPSTCKQIEDLLSQYLQYCYICDSKFKFESYQSGYVNINFRWTDSFNASKMSGSTQMKYEICCCLYNLAIAFYSFGCNLMGRHQLDDRKEAIKKFRYGIWALQELKNFISSVAAEVKNTHTDFSLENISILENIMFGLVYSCLYENLQPQQKELGGIKNVIQLAGESAKYFAISQGMVNQLIQRKVQGYPQELISAIHTAVTFNFTYYTVLTAQQMAVYHEKENEDDSRGKHIGWALSYLKKGQQIALQLVNDKFTYSKLSQDQKQKMETQINYINTNLPKLEQRNNEIYKQPVKAPEELPQTKITFQNLVGLSGLKPPGLEQKITGTQGFDGFLNEDQLLLVQECKSTTETRQMELNQALNQLSDMKNKAYLENYINALLDATSQGTSSSQAIPNSIKSKFQKIKELGGQQVLTNLTSSLKEFSVNCGMMIQQIRSKLDQEAAQDQQQRQQYQQKWTRQESFKSNQEYYKRVSDLEEKFKQAQGVDQEIMCKFQRIQGDLALLGKSEQEIASMLPKTGDQEFAVKNQVQLNELKTLDNSLKQQYDTIRNQISNLTNTNINYAQEVQNCVQNQVPRNKIQEIVLKNLLEGIEEINKQFAIFGSAVSQIVNIAMELNQKRQSGTSNSVEQGEKISSGLQQIIDCFEECNGGLNFYGQLLNRLSDQEKKVNDYCMARDVEQKHLLGMIGAQQNVQQYQNQGGFGNQFQQQPFFNPQNNQFAQGQSVYMGQNNNQQQQFYNPYSQNQNYPKQ